MTVGEKNRMIVDMFICGKTYKEISEQLGIPYTTCVAIMNKYRHFGDAIFSTNRTDNKWGAVYDPPVKQPECTPKGLITRHMIQELYTELKPGQQIIVRSIEGKNRFVEVEMIYPHFLMGRGREIIRYDDVLRARCGV